MKRIAFISLVAIGLIICFIFIRIVLVENNNFTVSSINNETNNVEKVIFDKNAKLELSKIYPLKEGFTWYYYGPLDTGKVVTVSSIIQEKGKIKVNIKTLEDTRVGEGSPEERIKNGYYLIEKERIVENDRIVLQSPIEVGNRWINKDVLLFPGIKQKGGFEAQPITRITEIKDKVITTETIITGIKGFKNETYKEISQYKEGQGLINRVFDFQGVEDYTMFLRLEKWAEQPINKEKWYLKK